MGKKKTTDKPKSKVKLKIKKTVIEKLTENELQRINGGTGWTGNHPS